jgi:uncharacterized protein YigA (DUF484 family)
MADTQPACEGLDPSAVAGWLRDHPRFLAENPDLYRRLAPPARVHGEALADHMTAMLHAERAHAAAVAARAEGVLAAGRAAAGLAARVQEAVLALFAAGDVADCVATEFPAILGIDAASLCGEAFLPAGLHRLPPGTVARLLGRGSVSFRDAPDDSATLHAEAAALARHDALVRVPCAAPTLLALAARDPRALDAQQGSAALAFLGRAVAAALAR